MWLVVSLVHSIYLSWSGFGILSAYCAFSIWTLWYDIMICKTLVNWAQMGHCICLIWLEHMNLLWYETGCDMDGSTMWYGRLVGRGLPLPTRPLANWGCWLCAHILRIQWILIWYSGRRGWFLMAPLRYGILVSELEWHYLDLAECSSSLVIWFWNYVFMCQIAWRYGTLRSLLMFLCFRDYMLLFGNLVSMDFG